MTDPLDPQDLIAEAYRMEGISQADCRTIFLDWALVLPVEMDTSDAIRALLARHDVPDHPMTAVLREGLGGMAAPRRRGGWRARPRN